MTEPYRDDESKPSPELERLAREGRAARSNALEASADEATQNGDRYMREALAALHGAPSNVGLKLVAGAFMFAGITMVVLHDSVPAPVGVLTLIVAIVLVVASSARTPRANDAAVDTERNWLKARPFTVEGYFEVLSQKPRPEGVVRTRVTWAADSPKIDEQLMSDAIAVVDPHARVENFDDAGLELVSGPIRGETGSSINRQPVLRNHRYPAYLHKLIDGVLAPLSKSYPIDTVKFESE